MSRSRRVALLPLVIGLSMMMIFFTGIASATDVDTDDDVVTSASAEPTSSEEPTPTESDSDAPTATETDTPTSEPAPSSDDVADDGSADGSTAADGSDGATGSDDPAATTGGTAGISTTSSAPTLAFPTDNTSGDTPHGRIAALKTADVSEVPETGADVTFTLEVHNDTDLRFWIRSLEDDVFGSLAGDADCHVGTVLAAGTSCSFTHTAWLEGTAGTDHVNTFQVGAEHYGWMLWAADSEIVSFTAVEQPHEAAIAIHKTAHRATVPETGANVVFAFEVHNVGTEELEIEVLDDDVFGSLAGDADCKVGTSLAAGASCAFTHSAWIEGDAPGEHVNTVTVRAGVTGSTDTVTDTATETVGFTTVTANGHLTVTKDADRESVAESGADVTFTFTVSNHTALRFTITSLEDDVFGTLEGDADCQVGTVLPANGSCSFTHTAWIEGEVPGEHVNTVVVMADHFGWTLSARDTETVSFVDDTTAGDIRILKVADRATVPETGAAVTFTFTVRNEGDAPLHITTLVDDVFGPLAGDADCQIGTMLAPDAECSFEHAVNIDGVAPGRHVNTVMVEATVGDTTDTVSDTATEIVGFTIVEDVLGGGGSNGGENGDDTQVLGADGSADTTGGTAFTGGDVFPLVAIGAALAALGLTLAFVARRRTTG